jgi:hypothetical protein
LTAVIGNGLEKGRVIRPCFSICAGCAICYLSVNIKALETLRYSEHTCNYFGILDSWFSGKIYAIKRVLITRGILEFSWIEVFGKDHSIRARWKDTQYMDITPELTSNHISPILHPKSKAKDPSFFSQVEQPLNLEGINNEMPQMRV